MYRAKKSYETLGFQRGQSSKAALDIGLRAKITTWLDEMEVEDYTINDDLTIDVDGNLDLEGKLNGKLPNFIKFNKVNGYFDCSENSLTSLKGCPEYVRSVFYCRYNLLSSLEDAPKYVGSAFFCYRNKIKFSMKEIRNISDVKGIIYK